MKVIRNRKILYYSTGKNKFKTTYSFPPIPLILKLKTKVYQWSYKRYINKQIRKGYLTEDMQPLKCPYCECDQLETYQTFYDDCHRLEEYWVRCSNCKKDVGLWSYGYWMK